VKCSVEAETGCRLDVIDDGRVGWAYLLTPDGVPIGDVWLYNRVPAPPAIEWEKPPPFVNPGCWPHTPPVSEDDVAIGWYVEGVLLLAEVSVRGQAIARLTPGASPGWNRWAAEDGPCAQVWESDK
jgi:hypothetical protein